MTRVLRILTVCLLLAVPAAAGAQETTGVRASAQGVEIDFQNADIRVVVSALAEAAGLNVVFGTIPSTAVTLRTSGPVARDQLRGYLESLVRANGLEIVEEGGLLRISATAGRTGDPPPDTPQYGRGPQAGRAAALRLFVHPLNHAQAESVARTIGALFGISVAGGGDVEGPQSLSQQLRQQRMQPAAPEPAAPLPQPGGVDPARGVGIAAGLQSEVQVVPDSRTNALLIRATPADYETIRQAVQAIDARPLQVVIEVLIAEVSRDRQLGLGVSIDVPERELPGGDETVGGSLIGRSLGDVTIRATAVGGIDAEILLRALAADANVNILSRPVILAQNNQEARILVGSERPFIQLFRSLPTDAAIRDQVVQYRDVGTQLTIRPTINPDGYVNLSVLQEVSNATSETQFGAPIISTREAQTELMVKDGHTAVIGGLVDNQREHTTSGIPFLKDIPLLGYLFRSTQRRNTVTELFLFLTPRVIRTDEEMRRTTEDVRDATTILKERLPGTIPLLPPADSVRTDTVPPPGTPARKR